MTSLQREYANWMSWCTLVHPIPCGVNTLNKDLLTEVSQSGQERWRSKQGAAMGSGGMEGQKTKGARIVRPFPTNGAPTFCGPETI